MFNIADMRIISLVDNVPGQCPGEHGLSLWIELAGGMKILFDTGQGSLFLENARSLGLEIGDIDIAVISHGHYDHGGGLGVFLDNNRTADVYLRSCALEPHYSLKEYGLKNIGLISPDDTGRLVSCDGTVEISPGLTLFANSCCEYPLPEGNSNLIGPDKTSMDDFFHEHNLLVRENGKTYVFAGCAHCGAANILATAERIAGGRIDFFIGGMHLMRGTDDDSLAELARMLLQFEGCRFVTMHCTGEESYLKLRDTMGDRINYLACGESMTL